MNFITGIKTGHGENMITDDCIIVENYPDEMVVCLFSSDAKMPKNAGAVAKSFDYETFKTVRTKLWNIALKTVDLTLIVSGLTPALTEFIKEFATTGYALTLLHYNEVTGKYSHQKIL